MTPTLATILTKQYDRLHDLAHAQADYGPWDEAWMRLLYRVPDMYGLLMREVFAIEDEAVDQNLDDEKHRERRWGAD